MRHLRANNYRSRISNSVISMTWQKTGRFTKMKLQWFLRATDKGRFDRTCCSNRMESHQQIQMLSFCLRGQFRSDRMMYLKHLQTNLTPKLNEILLLYSRIKREIPRQLFLVLAKTATLNKFMALTLPVPKFWTLNCNRNCPKQLRLLKSKPSLLISKPRLWSKPTVTFQRRWKGPSQKHLIKM